MNAVAEAAVTKEVSVNRVTYTIKGDLEAVFKVVARLFADYDPRGYGTRLDALDMQMDGSYVATVTRATSCG